LKSLSLKLILFGAATVFSLLAAEAFARMTVDQKDFLVPTVQPDPVLRKRIAPYSGGHDGWGFRNDSVPASVDIVAIGDSMTYGTMAASRHTWPAWLQRLSGSRVYNLGMATYGPLDYLHLLQTRASKLQPKTVVVGLYLGNDILDAFRAAYLTGHWASLRDPALADIFSPDDPSTTRTFADFERPGGWPARSIPGSEIRSWFKRHSVVYGMVRANLLSLLQPVELHFFRESGRPVTVLEHESDLLTVLDPVGRFRWMDPGDPRLPAGQQLTFKALEAIGQWCEVGEVTLLVTIIPTKINVFYPYFLRFGDSKQADLMKRLVEAENKWRSEIESWLDDRSIAHTDPLEDLRQRVPDEAIYPNSRNGHPTASGYRVIAEDVQRALSISSTRISAEAHAL
jgi:lysophospholipase L1-like esterase